MDFISLFSGFLIEFILCALNGQISGNELNFSSHEPEADQTWGI